MLGINYSFYRNVMKKNWHSVFLSIGHAQHAAPKQQQQQNT